ncbi:Nitric oxide dioxygenase [Cedecea lapagei]|uniref:Nitric oxide dioxygenase n=2 Tax=Cedecea lapagei TaxID=158823 RepID=A0A3S4IBI0_9ENTR|nr:Nitric oxide dioxygenase [Cedecea lapagei]
MSEKMTKQPSWHEGEIFLQDKVGVTERMAEVGQRVIRDYMPEQHRDFYAHLPFIVAGSVSPSGEAWATLLEGEPGFITSPTPTTLTIAARLADGDPATEGMSHRACIGLLGIELHTRRRNRMNGTLLQTSDGFEVEVEQSFGNCPRYIQLREFTFAHEPGGHTSGSVETLSEADEEARSLIQTADAFFVASWTERDGKRQADVSHRGGKPGFIRMSDDGTLTIPDFNGNLFFATLGNLLLNGQAGLLFVDFNSGDMLQMSGEAAVILDSAEIAAFQGAERLWTFKARRIVRRRNALALRWRFEDKGASPHSLMTGSWQEAASRIKAAELATRWRPFQVVKIADESRSIRSFYLQPGDGAGMLPHLAGQHLPVCVKILNAERPVIRTYTISSAPSDGFYRISVKRDGSVSRHLHNDVSVGDIIDVLAPAGNFTLNAHEQRPAVLLAGGVGITPMIAMLRHIVYEGLRKQRIRQTFLFQSARQAEDLSFTGELNELVTAAKGAVQVIRVLSQPDGAQHAVEYDVHGRIDMPLLTSRLPFNDYDFYLCGPAAFTQSLYEGLRKYNVSDNRIHAEAFGPSSLVRSTEHAALKPDAPPPSTSPVPVAFMHSLKEARWMPDSGSLLELAEARGLSPEFSCREGHCGSCRTKLLKGSVTYLKTPSASRGQDEVLICCAVPAQLPAGEENRIQLEL